jgi:TRAP-type transport system small permease protein
MRRLVGRLWSVIDGIIALLLAAMIIIVFTNVVLRYGFSSGLRQSVELARFVVRVGGDAGCRGCLAPQ